MELLLGDCLELLPEIKDDSVDLLFCDLPYRQTSLAWDVAIDLEKFWKEVNRVCKIDTPMLFTRSVKFGNTLINSNPKNFRYDLIWVKSAAVGFLNAKKQPMRLHEMVYVFYRKLPKVYTENISLHHTHKFIKETENKDEEFCKYDVNKNCYGGGQEGRIKISKDKRDHQQKYNPPLPNSVITRTDEGCNGLYGKETNKKFIYDEKGKLRNSEPMYDPPLPNSIIKTTHKTAYGTNKHHHNTEQRNGESIYAPPLPNSLLECKSEKGKHSTQKPVTLMEWILKYYSREGGLVLDPTMGSGSMGVACKNMKRQFIGIEKDDKIFEVAMERLHVEK